MAGTDRIGRVTVQHFGDSRRVTRLYRDDCARRRQVIHLLDQLAGTVIGGNAKVLEHVGRAKHTGPALEVDFAEIYLEVGNGHVKTTESGGPRGYDAGKKLKGRKRHILTDTEGNLVHAVIHTADIQDRDGAPLVLREIVRRFPWLRHIFADGGYAGDKLNDALRRISKWTVEIIKRSDTAKGVEVLPRRWVVERTLAWLNRNRRLAKDFEQTIASATAWLFIASIQLFARRIARV